MEKIEFLSTDGKTVLHFDFYNSKDGVNHTKICVKNAKGTILEHGFMRADEPTAINEKFIALCGIGKKDLESVTKIFKTILTKAGLEEDELLLGEMVNQRNLLAKAVVKAYINDPSKFSSLEAKVIEASKKAYNEYRQKKKEAAAKKEETQDAIFGQFEQYRSKGVHLVKPFNFSKNENKQTSETAVSSQ